MDMVWHQMSFNYFNTFITTQLFYNISDVCLVLIINYFSSILWCEDDMILHIHFVCASEYSFFAINYLSFLQYSLNNFIVHGKVIFLYNNRRAPA